MTVISPIKPYDDPLLDFEEAVSLVDRYMFSVFNAETATKTPDLAVRPKQKPRASSVAILNMIFSAERSDFVDWHAPSGFTTGLLNFVVQLHRLSFRAGETSEQLAITDRGRLLRWNEAVDKRSAALAINSASHEIEHDYARCQ